MSQFINFIKPIKIDYSLFEPKVIEFMNTDHTYLIGKSWLEVANTIKQFDPRIIIKHINLNNNDSIPKEINLGTIWLEYKDDMVTRIIH